MFNSGQLQKKWAPLLEAEGIDKITDNHRKAVTAQLLENQERFLREERAFLSEAPPTVNTDPSGTGNPGFSGSAAVGGPVAGFDPVLISLIRRSMPNLVAYDLAGVQPMNGPTGLIFAMRSRFDNQNGTEALFNEPDSAFSAQNSAASLDQGDYTGATDGGTDVGFGTTAQGGTNPSILCLLYTSPSPRDRQKSRMPSSA